MRTIQGVSLDTLCWRSEVTLRDSRSCLLLTKVKVEHREKYGVICTPLAQSQSVTSDVQATSCHTWWQNNVDHTFRVNACQKITERIIVFSPSDATLCPLPLDPPWQGPSDLYWQKLICRPTFYSVSIYIPIFHYVINCIAK